MYSVYFDNILQRPKDIIDINDSFETSIVRQDGFDSQAQIIREKSEANITFNGEAYKYVCDTLKLDACHVFQVKIEDASCGYVYNGTMSIVGMERDLSKCICKSDLKDNSFSAYIDGYMNIEIPLYYSKTKNCKVLNPIIKSIKMPNDVTDITLVTYVKAFDVLDVFKYIIGYFTDNTIEVVSTFLTDNKYAITTGFNMHRYGNSANEIYPNISIEKLFNELRKKLRLYMGIEYDAYGTPYLRIEQESYFFSDVELFSIAEIPKDTIQTYDNKRNFNGISVGSDTTKLDSGSPVTYPQTRYISWIKEFYTNCGSCIGEKDSVLNLVSNYIIDSNVIIEALVADETSDYSNDDSIFLWNYENIGGLDIAVMTLNASTGYYYYNETLRNENVLLNYLDYYQQCLAIQRNSKYGFYALYNNFNIKINTSVTQCCGYDNMNYLNIVYDNLDSISLESTSMTQCVPLPITDFYKAFICQENGKFNFRADLFNISQDTSVFELTDVIYLMKIKVYSDNTMTTLLSEYQATDTQDGYTNVSLSIETGEIDLLVGNMVMVTMYVESCPVVYPTDIYFYSDYASFELISDDFICDNQTTSENTKPYVTRFTYPLCFVDYNKANNNKGGYILLNNTKQWIKELNYVNSKVSEITLMSNELLFQDC